MKEEICDVCKTKYKYCFYINDEFWLKATDGVKEGHLCANCILEKLGGLDWYIIWNEGTDKMSGHYYNNKKL